MNSTQKKKIPIMEGFWTTPTSAGEEFQLVGSKCLACGELFFPKRERNWCVHCYGQSLEDIKLSRRGRLVSFSVVMQQPGGGFYRGPVPYAYGLVDLPEGVRVEGLLKTDDFEELKVGKEVQLVIDTLCENDEGNEVLTFKFEPI